MGIALEHDAKWSPQSWDLCLPSLAISGTQNCGPFSLPVIYSACPLPNCSSERAGEEKKKKYILLCFLPGMVLYQCMQFSQEETHNSFFARYPCGSGGERRCGTKQAIVPFCVTGKRESESLACKTNAVYHREGRSFSIPLHRVLTECA